MAEIGMFFAFIQFYSSKNYFDFGLKSGIWRIKSEKFVDFSPKLRKLVGKIKDDG